MSPERDRRISSHRGPERDLALLRPSAGAVSALELGVPSLSDVEGAESVALLSGGDAAYPAMLRAIEDARWSVHLEVYAFSASGIGARFVEALVRAARRGVAVRVRVDGWGSVRDGRSVVAALRAGGCQASIHNPLRALLLGRLGRNHRKLLLVDDALAFLGGINIGDENVGEGARVGWADLALAIRGPECVRLGQLLRRERRDEVRGSLRIYLCALGGGWRLRRSYLHAFAGARTRIHVAHGYFLPDRGLVRAITAAARRGVQVRLLLAGRSDVPFARAATRSLYRRLLTAGVEIHEWTDSVLHAKVTTVDGERLLVGSFNLDPFSLANLEALVTVDDARVVARAESWIQERLSSTRCVTSVESSTCVRRWLLDPAGRLVARLAEAMSRMMASRATRLHSEGPAHHFEGPSARVPPSTGQRGADSDGALLADPPGESREVPCAPRPEHPNGAER